MKINSELEVLEDVEVVFNNKWFTKEDIDIFGVLNKKPFVFVKNIGFNDTPKHKKDVKLRRSFISMKKIYFPFVDTTDAFEPIKDEDERIELSEDDESINSENLEELLRIRERLLTKVKQNMENKKSKLGFSNTDYVEELKRVKAMIEKNSQLEIE